MDTSRTADALRIKHALVEGEPPVAVLARGIINKNNEVVYDGTDNPSGDGVILSEISDMSADARTRNTKTDAELQSQLAILPQVTGASTWDEFQPGKPVVYAGGGDALYIANSVKTGLTIVNIGVSGFDLWDVSNTNYVTVSPGEAVLFDTVDEGEGVFFFSESVRASLCPPATVSQYGSVHLATAISDNSSSVVTSALAKAALDAKANMREIKTSNFTAAVNGRYTTDGTVSVTDPSGTAAGQIYSVLCGSGTATIGGTAYSPSRLEIVRYYNGSAWSTLTPTITDSVTLGSSLVFEGATVDANKTTVSVVDPTASRTITLPNATGTVMLGKASLSRFASEMATYSNNAKTVVSFGTATCVQFNDGADSAVLELLLNPAQWAGKTVRLGAILAVNGTSAGNLRLRFRGGYCNAAALNGAGNGGYMLTSGGNATGFLGDGVSDGSTGSDFAAPTTSGNPLLVESGNITIPSTAVQIFFSFRAHRANAGDTNTDTLYIHEIRVTEQ